MLQVLGKVTLIPTQMDPSLQVLFCLRYLRRYFLFRSRPPRGQRAPAGDPCVCPHSGSFS